MTPRRLAMALLTAGALMAPALLAQTPAPLTPEAGSPAAWFPVDGLPEPRVGDLEDLLALVLPVSRQFNVV